MKVQLSVFRPLRRLVAGIYQFLDTRDLRSGVVSQTVDISVENRRP